MHNFGESHLILFGGSIKEERQRRLQARRESRRARLARERQDSIRVQRVEKTF